MDNILHKEFINKTDGRIIRILCANKYDPNIFHCYTYSRPYERITLDKSRLQPNESYSYNFIRHNFAPLNEVSIMLYKK